jgi:tetratricopeptide (TPR) repeat protein
MAPGSAPAVPGETPQARSRTGQALYPPPLEPAERERRLDDLARARADLEARPDDPDAAIWVGRRLGYLGDFTGAIAAFTHGIELHPGDHRFYRHRGHRHITVREIDRAIADLSRAADLAGATADAPEPDGMPNAAGIPRSTLHGNVWYHLALAHYLRGDLEDAAAGWRRALDLSRNDDTTVAATHWLYLTLCRLGRHDEAAAVVVPVDEEMDILENHAYHELALLHRGVRSEDELLERAFGVGEPVDQATIGYGVAARRLCRGDRESGLELLRRVERGPAWPAFGQIAAEADLARLERE